jgi:hypothetical protein
MIVLHTGVVGRQFFLWGEQATGTPAAPVARRGRKPRQPEVQPLPFAAAEESLSAALKEAVPALAGLGDRAEQQVLWLPTAAGRPVASTPLVAETPAAAAEAVVAPWTITGFPLPSDQAIDLLAACLDLQTLAPGVHVGTSLAYWATALRFAGALVAREQFLPDVQHSGREWHARWKPALAGAEGQRFDQLARAMPGVCRALGGTADAPPDRPASVVLADFLAAVVDALVRSAAGAEPAAPVRRGRKKAAAFDSIHDQWLHALRAPGGELSGKPDELAGLAEQVRGWQRPVAVSAAAPFRLCFRLEEPAAGDDGAESLAADDTWNVRYLLQARDDPSLLLDVGDAWAPHGARSRVLQRDGFQPREYVLAALGQAAALCPPVEASLKAAAPAGFTADAGGAHRFLTESSWLLESACCCRPGGRARGPSSGWPSGPTSRARRCKGAAACPWKTSSSSSGGWLSVTPSCRSGSWRRWPGSRRRWSACAASGCRSAPTRSRPPSPSGSSRRPAKPACATS